ncbi:MAG TPA: hypothetical protein VHD62_04785 [Opitutaceae bacterium]|nr:hypothetical protein [Opitutaceae bacterium]
MTPAEKAVAAINARIERLQGTLRESKSEAAQRFLSESILVTIEIGEALTDYIKAVGAHAQRRHGALKDTHAALTAQHAEALQSGQALLERLKADPSDRALRKEIEATHQSMAAIQKNLRRGTNVLQRELAPSLASIDRIATSVRRFSEAESSDALLRALKTMTDLVREFYVAQRTLPLAETIDAAAWEKSARADIDQATELYDAYARAGYQAMLALETMTLAVAEAAPRTRDETNLRAKEAVAVRVKRVAARFAPPAAP